MVGPAAPLVASGAELAARQNSPAALRLLLVQRRAFRRGKRIRVVRLGVTLTIALLGPVLTTFDAVSDDLVGSAAGLWLVVSLLLAVWERLWLGRATRALEQFDCEVFGLAWNPAHGRPLAPEIVSDLAQGLPGAAAAERLEDWYACEPDLAGPLAVLSCQRSACVYSRRLHRAYLVTCGLGAAAAVVGLTVLFVVSEIPLGSLLIGFVLPALPGVVVADQLFREHRNSWKERLLFEQLLDDQAHDARLSAGQLRRNQDVQFRIRLNAPPLPELLYRAGRAKNKRAMAFSAEQFAQALRPPGGP